MKKKSLLLDVKKINLSKKLKYISRKELNINGVTGVTT